MDFKSLRNFSFIKNPKSWIVGGIALIGAAAMIEPKLRLEATNMGGTDTDEASLRTKEYAQSLFGSETENFLQKQKLDGLMKEWFDENPDDVMTRKQFAKLKRQSFGAESETELIYFTAPFNIKFDTRKEANAWVRDYQMAFKYPLKVRKMSGEHYVMYGVPWEYFDAEDWGGDPDGPLAKALARARAKSKEPRKPLKIVKLPHKDQKSLQDFGAENDNRQLEVTDQDYFGQNMDTASDGKMRIWHHNGLPRGEGIDTEEIVDRFAFRINKGMKVPLKYYEPVADIKVPYGDVFAATQNDFYDNGWLNSDIVEEVWTDEPQARSTSVGDVIHLYDKDLWFVVAPIGFLELEPMGDFKAEYGLSAENTINYGHLHNNMAADTRRFMKPTDVIDAFKKADGSLVSITFVKRTTGEVRKMLARTGVRKGVKGVGLKFNPRNKNLIGVYDFDKVREGADPSKCYRFVPIDAVISMKVRGKTYTA
jgi:hypothetical protein